jgi:hypothetical protein
LDDNINLNLNIMTVQQFWKGLAILIVSAILSILGQLEPDFAIFFLAGVSGLLGYIGKNLLFVTATTGFTKVISGLFVAIGAGIVDSLGLLAVNGVIVWAVLFKLVAGVFLTYIITTFLTPPAAQSRQITKMSLSKRAA